MLLFGTPLSLALFPYSLILHLFLEFFMSVFVHMFPSMKVLQFNPLHIAGIDRGCGGKAEKHDAEDNARQQRTCWSFSRAGRHSRLQVYVYRDNLSKIGPFRFARQFGRPKFSCENMTRCRLVGNFHNCVTLQHPRRNGQLLGAMRRRGAAGRNRVDLIPENIVFLFGPENVHLL